MKKKGKMGKLFFCGIPGFPWNFNSRVALRRGRGLVCLYLPLINVSLIIERQFQPQFPRIFQDGFPIFSARWSLGNDPRKKIGICGGLGGER